MIFMTKFVIISDFMKLFMQYLARGFLFFFFFFAARRKKHNNNQKTTISKSARHGVIIVALLGYV